MPNGTVEAIGKSRSGKPTVTIGGQVYSASQTEPPVTNLAVGDKIQFESASSVYNGATVWFLNSFKLLEAAIKYPSPTPQSPPIASPSSNGQSQGAITEAERIFAYGVVTAAIGKDRITMPEEIEKWVCAAKNALRSQGE